MMKPGFCFWESPDGAWKLNLTVADFDPRGNVSVLVNGTSNPSGEGKQYEDIKVEFHLTPFDFPLTDNTLLADGNRLATVLDGTRMDEHSQIRSVALRLIWFPKSYFTARERPMNYSEFRQKLGLKP